MPLEKLLTFTDTVSELADKPNATLSAAQVKAIFDAAPNEVRTYLNKLIDVLQSVTDGDSGADNIKVTGITDLTGGTVQEILESLKALDDSNKQYLLSQIGNVVLGQIPDSSITDVKLSDEPTEIKGRVAAHEAEKATDTTLGHVKVDGTSITVDGNGTISVNRSNVLLNANRLLSMGGML